MKRKEIRIVKLLSDETLQLYVEREENLMDEIGWIRRHSKLSGLEALLYTEISMFLFDEVILSEKKRIKDIIKQLLDKDGLLCRHCDKDLLNNLVTKLSKEFDKKGGK